MLNKLFAYCKRIFSRQLFYFMRVILIIASIIISGYSGQPHENLYAAAHLSKAQTFINNLRDSLQREYSAASSPAGKEIASGKYHRLLQDYLMSNSLDSITVKVDTVISEGWKKTEIFTGSLFYHPNDTSGIL